MTLDEQDTTAQAPPSDEPETTSVDCATNADQTVLAWSDAEPETEPQRRSWTRTVGIASGIVACGAAAAAGLWLAITGFKPAASNHSAPSTVPSAPITTVTQTVSAAPAQPPTTTVQASDAANDQLFLRRLATDGFNNNTPEMAGYAHQVCNSLRQGQPETQVVQWLASVLFSPNDTHNQWASLFVNDAKVSYPNCAPIQSEGPPAAPAPAAPSVPCYYSPAHPECPPKGLTPEQRENY